MSYKLDSTAVTCTQYYTLHLYLSLSPYSPGRGEPVLSDHSLKHGISIAVRGCFVGLQSHPLTVLLA